MKTSKDEYEMNHPGWTQGISAHHARLGWVSLLFSMFVTLTLLPVAALMAAEVLLPNGAYSESIVDLRVKVLGGSVTVERQHLEGRWQINSRWNSLKFNYDSLDGSIKSIDRNGALYQKQGDAWIFDKK